MRSSTLFGGAVSLVIMAIAVLLKRAQHQLQVPYKPWHCTWPGVQCATTPVHGYVDPQFESVRRLFEETIARGDDMGAGLAVYVDKKLVMDVHGGWQRVNPNVPYSNDTLQVVYSCTKVLSNIIIAQLVGQGLLDYDAPIATYWPEFAQGNKEQVTVGELVQYKGGVGFFEEPLPYAIASDPTAFSAWLAARPHNFDGVPVRSYHAVSIGYYLNEIVRRVDPQGRSIGQIAEDEMMKNYGVEWHLSPDDSYASRLAQLYRLPVVTRYKDLFDALVGKGNSITAEFLRKSSIVYKSVLNVNPDALDSFGIVNSKLRTIEGPAYSGFTNAASIAKMAAMMANGGRAIVPGEPDLLDAKTYALATARTPADYDHFLMRATTLLKGGFGVFEWPVPGTPFYGWTGAGGALFLWNDELQIGFGYTTNGIIGEGPDSRTVPLMQEIVRCVKARTK
ncbi:beta-lactamase/transpeptidase-like protein [Gongronella butleri]|nr:beta-lactamase/transpeptidase-like protein [Gongronella butleri]